MFGVIIVAITSFFDELANSIVKVKLQQKQISYYSIGVLNNMVMLVVFSIVNILKGEFRFAAASLPTFSLRAIMEVFLTIFMLKATEKADRSTFGFIRVLTIPLLLLVDLILGYKINNWQLAGIGVIILSLFIIFYHQGIKKQGAGLSFLTAVMAVATISLYKYDITNYNSVAAEQTLIYIISFLFLFSLAVFKAKENPFVFLKQKIYRWQILFNSVSAFFGNYAYIFAPASVIISAIRSSAVFWSVISGKVYFKEKNLLIKAICLILLVGGIVLLVLKS